MRFLLWNTLEFDLDLWPFQLKNYQLSLKDYGHRPNKI